MFKGGIGMKDADKMWSVFRISYAEHFYFNSLSYCDYAN